MTAELVGPEVPPQLVTGAELGACRTAITTFTRRATRPFLAMADEHPDWALMDRLCEAFPDNQFALFDAEGAVAAVANSIPFWWDGDVEALRTNGFSWALAKGYADAAAAIEPNAASMLLIGVRPDCRARGFSRLMLRRMRDQLQISGIQHLLGPLRPTLKSRYPLIPMTEYATWTTAAGEPFDPWLRTHVRHDAEILAVCETSSVVRGTVAEWEARTGMELPASGAYVVPDMLSPLEVDHPADVGVYTEANIWVRYPVA